MSDSLFPALKSVGEFAVSFVGQQFFQVRCYLSIKIFSLEASNCIATQQYMASLSEWLSLF